MSFMNFIIATADTAATAATTANAEAKPAGGLGGFTDMLPIIIVFGVMIFFMIRSQKKQQQKREQMISQVMKGSEVILNSGIYGTIQEVKEDSFIVKISNNSEIKVLKSAVGNIIPVAEKEQEAK